ncbi:hypothetical protein HK102_004796 [Quaeritorhiza haematococci]|nr:hypothetical protein HK102_004796 [Quaeritorhiza haematococci]
MMKDQQTYASLLTQSAAAMGFPVQVAEKLNMKHGHGIHAAALLPPNRGQSLTNDEPTVPGVPVQTMHGNAILTTTNIPPTASPPPRKSSFSAGRLTDAPFSAQPVNHMQQQQHIPPLPTTVAGHHHHHQVMAYGSPAAPTLPPHRYHQAGEMDHHQHQLAMAHAQQFHMSALEEPQMLKLQTRASMVPAGPGSSIYV